MNQRRVWWPIGMAALVAVIALSVLSVGCSLHAAKPTISDGVGEAKREAERIVGGIYSGRPLGRLTSDELESIGPASQAVARSKLTPSWRVLGVTIDSDGTGEIRYYCVIQLGRDDSEPVRAETVVLVHGGSGDWSVNKSASTLFDKPGI